MTMGEVILARSGGSAGSAHGGAHAARAVENVKPNLLANAG